MVLLCYDGSADSRAAIEGAAELFADQPVTVLTVWQPFVEVVARTTVGFGMVPSIPDSDDIDDASAKSAEQTAGEGVELAQKLGLSAKPVTSVQTSTTARAILAEADKLGASAIVMGVPGPDRRQVAAARERLARGDPARRPHRRRRALAGRAGLARAISRGARPKAAD